MYEVHYCSWLNLLHLPLRIVERVTVCRYIVRRVFFTNRFIIQWTYKMQTSPLRLLLIKLFCYNLLYTMHYIFSILLWKRRSCLLHPLNGRKKYFTPCNSIKKFQSLNRTYNTCSRAHKRILFFGWLVVNHIIEDVTTRADWLP